MGGELLKKNELTKWLWPLPSDNIFITASLKMAVRETWGWVDRGTRFKQYSHGAGNSGIGRIRNIINMVSMPERSGITVKNNEMKHNIVNFSSFTLNSVNLLCGTTDIEKKLFGSRNRYGKD